MKRASNTFGFAEIAALLRVASAVDRGDIASAQHWSRTAASVSARGKLQRMRDRLLEEPALAAPEPEPDEPARPVQRYKRAKWGADRGEA